MEYRTVFDFAESGYSAWPFAAFGVILLGWGTVLIVLRRRFPGRHTHRRGIAVFAFFWIGFVVLWTLLALLGTYGEYARLRAAINEGRARVVEGVVSQFRPMPVSGHAMERFCVADDCFEYSDFVVTNGFNNTSSHGGPIRQGLPVRVTFVRGTIVKLEISK